MSRYIFYRVIVAIFFIANVTLAYGQFTEIKKLFDSEGAANDEYGFEVAISNDIAIVGARKHDENGSNSGAVYIYEMNQEGIGNWGLVKKLQPSDLAAFDEFGIDVDIDGNRAIVGSSNDDDNGSNSGSVYIFEKDQGGTNNWGQVKKIVANESTFRFAENIAIFDDLIIVGAIYDAIGGTRAGAAYIFEKNQGGVNNWGQVKKLKASDPASDDRFGENVDISSEYAAVGSRLDDDNGNFSGSAYVFKKDHGGSNNWGQVKKLLPFDGDSSDNFGSSVVVEDNIVAVGAWADTDDGFRSGSVYIFEKTQGGADNWGEIKKVQSDVFKPQAGLGWSIALDNGILIAGAPTEDVDAGDSGAVYIYDQNEGGPNNWGFIQKIFQSGGGFNDRFGESVSIHNDLIIVGSNLDDDNGSNQGSAYIFGKPPTCEIIPITVYLDQAGILVVDTSDLIITNFDVHDTVYISRDTLICSDVLLSPVLDSLIGITGSDTTTCTFEVTVLDTISPTATCQDITTYLDSFGLVTVSPIAIPHTTDDNCAANLIRVFPDDFTCVNLGANPATFQTIDPSGNTGDCPMTITVVDSFPPFTECRDLTIYLDDIGFYFLTADDIDSITHLTYDNCSIDSVGISQEDFSCADMPFTLTTITFKDQSGNISTCDVTITVLDTFPPVLTCTDLTRDLQSNQMADLLPADAILFIDDNCGIDTQFLSRYTFQCADITPFFQQDTLEFVSFFNVFPTGEGGGVDADQDRIYVSDPDNGRVKVFDYNGNIILDFNTGHQSNDIAVDENGNIYVISYILNRIQVYNSSGQSQFFFSNQVNQPVGIEVYNNKLYVANEGSGHVNRHDLNGNFESTIAFEGSGLKSLRVSQDKIVTCKTSFCRAMDLNGVNLYNLAFSDLTYAGVFDTDDNLYMPQFNTGQLSIHNGSDGSERFSINLPVKSVTVLGDKLFTLDQDVNTYNLILTEGDPPIPQAVTFTARDNSGNEATCTSNITISDTHGYCCPDSLIVNYNPIDSTNYYASDSICSNGLIASGTNVNFRSTLIKLDTSFQVNTGGVFQVLNEDCNQ